MNKVSNEIHRALVKSLKGFHLNLGLFSKFPILKKTYDYLLRKTKPQGILLLKIEGSKMFVNTKDEGVSRLLFLNHSIEPVITQLFRKEVKKGMTIADVGANIGYYTLLCSKLVGDSGKVFAFEPIPQNYSLLKLNVKENNYRNVEVIEKAVSDRIGKTKIFLDENNFGNNTLIDGTPDASDGFIEIETITLDNFFEGNKQVDFMKIDAEGAEGLIIDGAGKILQSNNMKIILEFWPYGLRKLNQNPDSVLRKLRSYGYKIKLIDEHSGQIAEATNSEIIVRFDKTGFSQNLFLEK